MSESDLHCRILRCANVLSLILGNIEGDPGTLYSCSLVSREWKFAASKVLYTRVLISPAFQRVLDLKANAKNSQSSLLNSSSLPQNAVHVLELEISGYLSPRPLPSKTLATQLSEALRSYCNLHSVILTPQTFHPDLFIDVLHALKDCPSLRRLTVNSSCTDESKAPILAKINRLDELGIVDPTRAVLQLLPEWLERLSVSLVELHLKNNCGSISPGILRSFIPHTQQIRSLTLGLSYSLANEDVFSFLGQLPQLESAQLHYYLQLRCPARMPVLRNLRSFTVKYQRVQKREDANRLCVWIRRAVASSPLEYLGLICDDMENYSNTGPNISFDSLISHLAMKHSGTLRFLHIPYCFVGLGSLKTLCGTCVNLEELTISLGINALWAFKGFIVAMKKLHTVSFQVRNLKRSKFDLETPKFAEIMCCGSPSLQRLSVNGIKWEGSWVSENPPEVKWVVRQTPVKACREAGKRT